MTLGRPRSRWPKRQGGSTGTRVQGFGLRDPHFGGDFDEGCSVVYGGRDFIAVPIRMGDHIPGMLNITWAGKVHRREWDLDLLFGPADAAAAEIARCPGRSTTVSRWLD